MKQNVVNLIIENHGNLVRAQFQFFASSTHCVGSKVCFKGIYGWDIIIENDGEYFRIRVCKLKGFKYNCWAGKQANIMDFGF